VSLRKPTLDEWFLAHQLRALGRDSFFNPGTLEVDVTAIVERHRAREARPSSRLSYTALVIKALALTAREVPEINRAYLRTPFGDRVAEFDHVSVNLPVALRENGKSYLSAIVVRDADGKSVAAIAEEIRAAQARPMDDTKITKIVARRPNTLLWRSVLRGIHFAAYRWPGMAAMGAGGLSVSSVIDHREEPPAFRAASFGPTAMTVLITGVRSVDGRHQLELGLGLNHVAMTGQTFRRMVTVLSDLLSTSDPDALAAFD
jgi:hypothetical protein